MTTGGPVSVIAVLGAGNMAGAISKALAASAAAPRIRLTTRTSVPEWAALHDNVEHVATAADPRANAAAVTGAEAVILGVKPAQVVDLAREIAPDLSPGTLVLSVAAGVTLDQLSEVLPDSVVPVRTMPNTPVAVGKGVTAFVVRADAPAGSAARVRDLLSPTGTLEEIEESVMDGFSATAGSGPAYVFLLIEAMVAAAQEQGMDAQSASRIVPQMIGGAVEYLQASGREPGDLRVEVTSPNGATAAALAVFEDHGLRETVSKAIAASAHRAGELGKG